MVQIQNQTPRHDIHGRVIDCHDGCVRWFDGAFYLYGTRYGDTDGFTKANRYVLYRSDDLAAWTPLGEMLSEPLDGVCYRPYVAYNQRTGRYVMWFNWYPVLWEGQFGVATAERPEGPFVLVNPDVRVAQPRPGDHNLFVDDDGTGYLIYTSIQGDGSGHHGMSVERLDAGYTASAGENGGVFATEVEAPSMFKRGGVYFAVFGGCCCFCPQGANAAVYRAQHPLGPWARVGELNRDAGGTITVAGQQTDIAVLPSRDGPRWVWMADRWGSRPDGIKGHDLQHWEPLRFDASGLPLPLTGAAAWEYTR